MYIIFWLIFMQYNILTTSVTGDHYSSMYFCNFKSLGYAWGISCMLAWLCLPYLKKYSLGAFYIQTPGHAETRNNKTFSCPANIYWTTMHRNS